MKHLTFRIGGMTCQHCVITVKRTLEEVAGVISAKVDLSTEMASVQAEPGFDVQQAIDAVQNAGYHAELLQAPVMRSGVSSAFNAGENTRFDLIILGGGAAAFAAAIRARDLGASVLMINDGLPLGGTCVNVGCVPSKFLSEALKHYWLTAHAPHEWLVSSGTLNYPNLIDAKDRLVSALRRRNYYDVLEALGNVTLVEGYGRFVEPRTVAVNDTTFTAERIIIATGAHTLVPPIPGLQEVQPLNHITALQLRQLPRSIAVIGGGPMGMEFAQMFHRAGADVSAVELMGRILPQHDAEVSQTLTSLLESEGIRVKAGCRLERVERLAGTIKLYDSGGCVAEVEQVMVATGVRANTAGLGLEAIGVETDARGFIRTDDRQETSVPGIFAAGDVTGKMPLETVAAKQGFHAAHNALTGDSLTIDYHLVPHAVFTDPQVASVGCTEEAARQQMGSCLCRSIPLEAVPKAHAAGDTRGMVKLVVEPETRRIVGAHAVAVNAAEIIHIPLIAMHAGFTVEQLIDVVHVFPTYAEAWKICAQTFEREITTMSCCVV